MDAGQVIGNKYRLVRSLARGGMGTVWVARHIELDVDVALKFPRTDGPLPAGAERRFRREARAAAQLKSPHAVHIYDFGVEEGLPYIAMELLAGEDLGTILQRRECLPVPEAVVLLMQAARGLRAAHRAELIHRDIKPSNLFVAEEEESEIVKVLDFGIAFRRDDATDTTGAAFGSPAYMSPEQARGASIDERTDIWALGAVFYRAVTGVVPFDGANAGDVVVKLCTEAAVPPSQRNPDLDPSVDDFVNRALAHDTEARFSSIDAFADALRALAPREAAARGPRPSDPGSLPRGQGAGRRSSASGGRGRDTETEPLSPPGDSSSKEGKPQSETPAPGRPREHPSGRPGMSRALALAVVLLAVAGGFWYLSTDDKEPTSIPTDSDMSQPAAVSTSQANSEGATSNETRDTPSSTASGPGSTSSEAKDMPSRNPEKTSAGHDSRSSSKETPPAAVRDSSAETSSEATSAPRPAPKRAPSPDSHRNGEDDSDTEKEPPTDRSPEQPATDPVFGLPVTDAP